jgi:hypothetical protein
MVRTRGSPANSGRFAHRPDRVHPVGAEPVVARHRVRVQLAQPVLAFAQRRGGDRIGVGAGAAAPQTVALVRRLPAPSPVSRSEG